VASLFKGQGGVAGLFERKGSWPHHLNKIRRGMMVSAKSGRGPNFFKTVRGLSV
jgi:hypothetical protein